jgi:hypothetical protein
MNTQNFYENWSELRLKGNAPERRSYHSSFVYENRLFIFGGLDIREGSLNNLWELNLTNIRDLEVEEGYRQETCGWKQVKTTGSVAAIPDKIAYHTSVVYKDNMYLFGGNNYSKSKFDSDEPAYVTNLTFLNLKTMGWSQIKTRGDPVTHRDEHSAVIEKDKG